MYFINKGEQNMQQRHYILVNWTFSHNGKEKSEDSNVGLPGVTIPKKYL